MKAIISLTACAALLGLVPADTLGQCCGDCNGDGQVTINELVTAVNRALEGCQDDGICSHTGGQRFPASGQTTAYGPGSDGEVRAGAAPSFTDNGDGTIIDNNTKLMWEKKDQSRGIHDINKIYSWSASGTAMDGTITTEFLATLNQALCFAGYCDWRIPNAKELQSIVDYELAYPGPLADTAFNNNCVAGCTVNGQGGSMCSCTASGAYWSSTTDQHYARSAYIVGFDDGSVSGGISKTSLMLDGFFVRAVRGGL